MFRTNNVLRLWNEALNPLTTFRRCVFSRSCQWICNR